MLLSLFTESLKVYMIHDFHCGEYNRTIEIVNHDYQLAKTCYQHSNCCKICRHFEWCLVQSSYTESSTRQWNYKENMYNFVVITAPADGLAQRCARPSAGTVMTKFTSSVYTGRILGRIKHKINCIVNQIDFPQWTTIINIKNTKKCEELCWKKWTWLLRLPFEK